MNGTLPVKKDYYRTIVIGAGQAGLAAGYHLQRLHEDFLIIDGAHEIGHSWLSRWDSLKLFTPRWANGLPGMRFMRSANKFPHKDEMALFLRKYVSQYNLPVQLNTKVHRLFSNSSGYSIETDNGKLTCTNVIVATGSYAIPRIPALADQLDPRIHQVHSSGYHNPRLLPSGSILVVGAGTSGLQIALDVAGSGRKTYVAGTPPFKVPYFALKYLSRPFLWAMKHVLTINTRPGRKVERQLKQEGKAAPLINISLEEVMAAGVEHLPRLEKIQNGYPVFDGNGEKVGASGKRIPVEGIIWCTGYNRDFSWIQLDNISDEHGYPLSRRGVSTHHQGLYFMGMMFQYALSSTMINGVGRDARYIAAHIATVSNKG